MSSYILTSRKSYKKAKRWLLKTLSIVAVIVLIIFSFNYIVDPYNMTQQNILNIQTKIARDDRVEKTTHFRVLDQYFENILIGSSRVYTIDPKYVSKKLGGSTYNFGVGTANVEDHLGILLFLQKYNKLPKNLIIGIDFYTFNPDIPPNQYFLKNKELNFLSYSSHDEQDYWNKFFTFDALRASWKTFKNHIKGVEQTPTFDTLGWSPRFFDNRTRDLENEKIGTLEEIEKNSHLYSNFQYKNIDRIRVAYYEKIKEICDENNVNLFLFVTPLHPLLIEKIISSDSSSALSQLDDYFLSFRNYHNFFYDTKFNDNLYNFQGATHTTSEAGYKIIDRLIHDENLMRIQP